MQLNIKFGSEHHSAQRQEKTACQTEHTQTEPSLCGYVQHRRTLGVMQPITYINNTRSEILYTLYRENAT